MAAKCAIFLDKDGTLIPDIPYNADPERVRLEEHVGQTLAMLAPHFELIVISNQSGLAFGYFNEGELKMVEKRIKMLLHHYGVSLSGFYYCPHHPDGNKAPYARPCDCRKPAPGLINRAALEHHISLSGSWMIGDILNDVQAGKAAGCSTILINNGNETEWDMADHPQRIPDFMASDFAAAGEFILNSLKYEKYIGAISAIPGELQEQKNSSHRRPDTGPLYSG
ncbi:D-glycero-alpha-D-manno-heptose-1,7-bisphosphate 7-phosphatase [Pedobacter sp. KLB.chiD]|uniref:D-glycero-alpha-D-manno-heptose-1,7-bisphosphate 7-phosphatase n=1 Tax=Pedobacter sp. KLB.chiD TaxID=3387402 RepID=UPI00399A72D0